MQEGLSTVGVALPAALEVGLLGFEGMTFPLQGLEVVAQAEEAHSQGVVRLGQAPGPRREVAVLEGSLPGERLPHPGDDLGDFGRADEGVCREERGPSPAEIARVLREEGAERGGLALEEAARTRLGLDGVRDLAPRALEVRLQRLDLLIASLAWASSCL
jgi:hypothetical protein